MVEFLETGIPGLDTLLKGGLPKGRIISVCGGPGTGKTTFGIQFLIQGALNGENGALLSLEETPEQILEDTQNIFGEEYFTMVAKAKGQNGQSSFFFLHP